MKLLEIILKTVERCNINCTYCYFFNSGDQSYETHKAVIQKNTIMELIEFLKKGIQDLDIKYLIIDIHGGEPLLQKKQSFSEMCDQFFQLKEFVDLTLNVQTNGMLIDDEWINIFHKYKVGVGVSIDGPKEYHDKFRVDHKGNGTYDRVIKGLVIARDAYKNGLIHHFGVLSVINPDIDPIKLLDHFVNDLKIDKMDFLLPDTTHDQKNWVDEGQYGIFLKNMYDHWMQKNDPNLYIRIFNFTIKRFLGKDSALGGYAPARQDVKAITISSNGDLGPDDIVRVADPIFSYNGNTIKNTTLKDFLRSPVVEHLENMQGSLPNDCQPCYWRKICYGGALVNRFSQENLFNNPSVFCHSLKLFYGNIHESLQKNGY